MGFNKKLTLDGNPEIIPQIANRIRDTFQAEGYEVIVQNLYSGGVDISLTKGGIFKAILGMKTALKVVLLPQGNLINFEASVGIFGQQVIPTLIMLFVTWPVLITQIWGLVKQSQLDDKVLAVANQVILEHQAGVCPCQDLSDAGGIKVVNGDTVVITDFGTNPAGRFCTNCGTKLPDNARFCSNCGAPLS